MTTALDTLLTRLGVVRTGDDRRDAEAGLAHCRSARLELGAHELQALVDASSQRWSAHGIDLSLLRENLSRTPQERLRRNAEAAASLEVLRRGA